MLGRFSKLGNRGDTIVEVLIVVVVLATVIGSTYALASRSQKTSQQVQEHTQALKIAEGQLESLKNSSGRVAANTFCFAADGTSIITGPFQDGAAAAAAQNDNLAGYPPECRQSSTGGTCSDGSFCYNYSITRDTQNQDQYTATVRWDGINGGIDNTSLVYRMPQ